MKRFVVSIALLVAITACGDDDTATTQPGSTTAATATTTSVVTSTTPTTTASNPTDTGSGDCLEIWPESLVQNITGEQYTFLAANDDHSACTYLAAVSGIALAWRADDANGFEQSRLGMGALGTVTEAPGVCDGAFYAGTEGLTFIMEAYSASQGRAFTATLTGIPLEQAVVWAGALHNAAC